MRNKEHMHINIRSVLIKSVNAKYSKYTLASCVLKGTGGTVERAKEVIKRSVQG